MDDAGVNNPLDFTGRVALVTGAAAGMGLATAQAFAEAGAALVLADYREEVVQAEADKLSAAGRTRCGERRRKCVRRNRAKRSDPAGRAA